MADTLLNVKADTAEDFLDEARAAMGDSTKLGETTFDLGLKFATDSKTKKIVKATFTLTTSIRRAHWAGPAKTKPDKSNAEAIARIEALNKAHEDAHRAGYVRAFNKNKAALEKALVGKTEDEAEAIVDKMKQALKDACEDLHKKGGKVVVKTDSSGRITVTEAAEGPGGCD